MIVFTLGVLVDAHAAAAEPDRPTRARSPRRQRDVFPLFLGLFLLIFFFTGIGNGSTYKMIPAIFKTEAERATDAPVAPSVTTAQLNGTKRASAAVGIIGAVGALGGFLIPITFSSPWVTAPLAATKTAFLIFTVFYIVCASSPGAVYLRKPAPAKARPARPARGSDAKPAPTEWMS